jgi:integrase
MGYRNLAHRVLPRKVLKDLRAIIDRHNKDAANGKNKRVGSRTRIKRQRILEMGIAELWTLGKKIEVFSNFKERHIETLAKYWESIPLDPGTLENKISVFRVFVNQWLGKGDYIKESSRYVSNPDSVRRQYVATDDKSWEAQEIDIDQLLDEVYEFDRFVGIQLKMEDAFGLRGNEAIRFRPHLDDHETAIEVSEGTKGGKSRIVPILDAYQRDLLDHAKEMVRTLKSDLRRPGQSEEQAKNRYYYVCRKFGITKGKLKITPHGLRHGYANREYYELTGAKSPVQGGKPGEIDQQTHNLAILKISRRTGHNRKHITGAYVGSFGHALRSIAKTPEEMEKARGSKPRLSWGQIITADAVLKKPAFEAQAEKEEEK